MPLSAADRMKRRTRSSETGFDPTRKRPRTAICSGVRVHRARSARIRSQGLSTPRRTAASKQPPPDTSRPAKPGAVQDLGHLEHRRRGRVPVERLLREEPDGGVDDPGHAREM